MKRVLLIGLLAFVLLVGGVLSIFVKRKWDAAASLQAISANGDPVTLSDVAEQRDLAGIDASTRLNDVVANAEDFQKATDAILYGPDFSWDGVGIPAENVGALKLQVAKNHKLFETLRLAAQSDRFSWDLNYSAGTQAVLNEAMNATSEMKQIARLASAKTRAFAAMGETESAVASALEHLQLFGLQKEPPFLTSMSLHAMCCEMALSDLNALIQKCELTDVLRSQIDEQLAGVSMEDQFVYALKTERALGLELIQANSLGVLFGSIGNSLQSYQDLLEKELKLGLSDPSKTDSMPEPGPGVHEQLLVPAIHQARAIAHRVEAEALCLRILNQVRAKVQSGGNTETIALDSLGLDSLGLDSELTTDPYDGTPIKIKLTNDGWSVYCVGPDKTDEGGSLDYENGEPTDVGFGPAVEEGN